jgi:hypothetical protein
MNETTMNLFFSLGSGGLRQTEGLRPGSPICFGQTCGVPFIGLLDIGA